MDVERATGAAKRWRERLRSWLRLERMTVAAELSAALHHSRDGRQVKHVGPRAQKTDIAADGVEVVQDAHEGDDLILSMRQSSLALWLFHTSSS